MDGIFDWIGSDLAPEEKSRIGRAVRRELDLLGQGRRPRLDKSMEFDVGMKKKTKTRTRRQTTGSYTKRTESRGPGQPTRVKHLSHRNKRVSASSASALRHRGGYDRPKISTITARTRERVTRPGPGSREQLGVSPSHSHTSEPLGKTEQVGEAPRSCSPGRE